jgi:pimeloyl-[acyl-carrier protein] methyl ester esterase
MHIEVTGTGPDLVMLHGWAMHGGILAPLVAQLREGWTVHIVDLPGHGHSRDDGTPLTLDALAADLLARFPRAVWLGWSLGGLVAQYVALAAPDRVQGLIAIASPPRFVAAADWPHGVDAAVFERFGAELADDWRGTVERFLALEVVGSAHAREDLRALRGQLFDRGEPAPRVLADGLGLLKSADLLQRLPTLAVPSLWVGGRRDRLVAPSAVQAAAALAPGGRAMIIAGAGHAPFLHHAGAIAAAIALVPGARS